MALSPPSWQGGPWVVDTSAWARASAPQVAELWASSTRAGELIACPVVTLELLYGARDAAEVERVATALAALRQAPVTRTVTDAAISAIRELAQGSAGAHRVRVPDALVAAAAADRGFGVLHYDHHFDRLATVLRFESQWLAPPGSIACVRDRTLGLEHEPDGSLPQLGGVLRNPAQRQTD